MEIFASPLELLSLKSRWSAPSFALPSHQNRKKLPASIKLRGGIAGSVPAFGALPENTRPPSGTGNRFGLKSSSQSLLGPAELVAIHSLNLSPSWDPTCCA